MKKHKSKTTALFHLVNLFISEGRLSSITATYKKILINEPNNIEVLDRLAYFYHLSGKELQREECLKEIIRIDPKNIDAIEKLGSLAYYKCGDEEEAYEYFRRILEIDPNNQNALSYLPSKM